MSAKLIQQCDNNQDDSVQAILKAVHDENVLDQTESQFAKRRIS